MPYVPESTAHPSDRPTGTRVSMSVWHLGLGLLLFALVLSACKAKVTLGNRMNAKDSEVWTVDGEPMTIDTSYFLAEPGGLAFVAEWTCRDCRFDAEPKQEDLIELIRPVLREALLRRETGRVDITRYGEGKQLVNRLAGKIAYTVDGVPSSQVLGTDDLNKLWDWKWEIDGRPVHLFGLFFYFDEIGRELYYTTNWHDPALCPLPTDLDDDTAGALAMPAMRRIVELSLHERTPRFGAPPEIEQATVEAIGITIVCPKPECEEQPDCPMDGFRVSRTLDQIRAGVSESPS